MEANDQQPSEARELEEAKDRSELGRSAHKSAWARMNGSNNAVNPFVEVDPNPRTPVDDTNKSSRHR
jgi:hypothetical protein